MVLETAIMMLGVMGARKAKKKLDERAQRKEALREAAEAERLRKEQQLKDLANQASNAERAAEQLRKEIEDAMVEGDAKAAQWQEEQDAAAERLKGVVDKAEKERQRLQDAQKKMDQDAREREERLKAEYDCLVAEARRQAEEADAARERAEQREKEDRERMENEIRIALEKAEAARQEAIRSRLQGIPPDVRPSSEDVVKFREKYGYTQGRFHVAVVGESGMGKSTLINGLRGLGPKDEGFAATGINETTREVTPYADPNNTDIVWYDVPGSNTLDVSDWLYFINMGLFVFDLLIIVYSDRFTTTAGRLIQEAEKCGIRKLLVRTKVDSLLRSAKDDQGLEGDAAKEMVLATTIKDVHRNLAKLNVPQIPVYLVSKAGLKNFVSKGDQSGIIHEDKLVEEIRKEKAWILG